VVTREHAERVIAAFFEADVAVMDMHLHEIAPPIVVGDEALGFFACHVGRGRERVTLDRIVDHFTFDDDGRIRAVRAFVEMSSTRPDPE
jgi:hypothetical protein